MTPEFSRVLSREELARGSMQQEIEANPAERAALAKRFDLAALHGLSARLRIGPGPGQRLVAVEGRLSARLEQFCVVTLDPVPAEIEEDFLLLFNLLPEGNRVEREVFVEPESADAPEPVGPEGLDLGEVVAEQLGLALEPYPRAPGASLELPQGMAGDEAAPAGPFAALAALKDPDQAD